MKDSLRMFCDPGLYLLRQRDGNDWGAQVLLAAHKQQLHAAEIEQLRNCLDVSGEPAMEVGQASNMLNQTS